MQAGRITREGSKESAWKGKRIKSKEVQEAAKSVMMTVLDGEGFIAGLKTSVKSEAAGSSDEYDAPVRSTMIANPQTRPCLRLPSAATPTPILHCACGLSSCSAVVTLQLPSSLSTRTSRPTRANKKVLLMHQRKSAR